MRGSRELHLHVACNDERGDFRGRVTGICLSNHFGRHRWTIDIDHDDFMDGAAFSVNEARLTFRLHNVNFPFKRRSTWVGNVFWDAFSMKRPQALRLMAHIARRDDWICNGGDLAICDWFDNLKLSDGGKLSFKTAAARHFSKEGTL